MKYYYDLYINDQYDGQYSCKADAISDAKAIFNDNPDICQSVKVIKCDSYDFRDGGDTVYKKTRQLADRKED